MLSPPMRRFPVALLLVAGCTSAPICADSVTTFTPPAGAAQPLHWAKSAGCVRTSYDPSYIPHTEYRALVQRAFDAWAKHLGDELCFDTLTDDTTTENAIDGAIHVTGGVAEEGARTTTSFQTSTGEITKAIVTIDILGAKTLELPDFIHLVGLALGLNPLPAGAESVMAIPVEYTEPTSHDAVAIHALYDPACKLY